MKLLLLCFLPVVLAAPQANQRTESSGSFATRDSKRFIFGSLQVDSLFDLDSLKCDVQIILDVVGSDPTEAACEGECHKLVQDGNLLNYGCPLICHAIQNLAHYFHETPKPGDQTLPCGGLTVPVGK